MDWGETLKYLSISLTPYRAKLLKVHHLLPVREHKKGPTPGMKSKNALGKDKDQENKWESVLKGRELTDSEKSLVMGAFLEVALVVLFLRHTYKFCSEIYLQQGGGAYGIEFKWVYCRPKCN